MGSEMASTCLIRVWPFEYAPEKYRELSTNGGDEDWLAVVATRDLDEMQYPHWLETAPFGVCCVDSYKLGEETIFIGSHS